jgi:myo-inositol 2-dehydrogenase / D-chiro-inositol 1-dehydrogenase
MNKTNGISRRDFVKGSAAVGLSTMLGGTGGAFAAGSDRVRVALLGCGERGNGAAGNCLDSNPAVDLVALGDLFPDKLNGALRGFKRKYKERIKVTPETSFLGFDACAKLAALKDLDIVIIATPPGFRPELFRTVIEGGKHVFMEKPGAVDPVGCRSLMETADLADKKKLSVVVGTQQRRQYQYIEVMKRVFDGQIGKLVGGQAYWHWGHANWHFAKRKPEWSDMEWQIRCWPYFSWLSGDHIVEQHLHNMDIINWAMGSPPIKCQGMGGRQARTSPDYGNIYDHFAVEYEYPGGVRVSSYCSQIEGSYSRVVERLVGSKGTATMNRGYGFIEGQNPYKYEGKMISGFVKEHADLIDSIRQGKPINEARSLAESTLTLIMGRMSAYTGRELSWKWVLNSSKLKLGPEKYDLKAPLPVDPIAIPGKTKLI